VHWPDRASHSGRAASKSSTAPPAITVIEPGSAAAAPPETGASIHRMPVSSVNRCAICRVFVASMVEVSMNS